MLKLEVADVFLWERKILLLHIISQNTIVSWLANLLALTNQTYILFMQFYTK